MDSLTQLTLGAAVGEAVAGRQAGTKAPLWGAVLGTLPDLDVLANPFLTEAQSLVFHRSLTHSLLFVAVMAPLVGWALHRFHAGTASQRRWMGLAGAVLLTHIGLDCLTSYGTQIFWPFSQYPVILATIFIIDPLYTVPLLGGLLTALFWSPAARSRRVANYTGLALSSAYLLLTVANKLHVDRAFAEALESKEASVSQLLIKPTPFNNLLWTGIAETDDGFYVGHYSLLDTDARIDFRRVPKQHDLLGDAVKSLEVQRIQWFSRGYYAVRKTDDGGLRVVDLRFGRSDLGLTEQGTYIFSFKLETDDGGQVVGIRREAPEVRLTTDLLSRFVNRIRGHESVAARRANRIHDRVESR
ncbi:MAG: metal-dependent hydrolase [Salinibacter sp.]